MSTNTSWQSWNQTFYDTFDAVNTQTNNLYAAGIVISLALIIAYRLNILGRELEEIFVYVGVVEFILCSFFIAMNWLAFYWLMFPTVAVFTGIIISVAKRR